jgi:hypothetical protein
MACKELNFLAENIIRIKEKARHSNTYCFIKPNLFNKLIVVRTALINTDASISSESLNRISVFIDAFIEPAMQYSSKTRENLIIDVSAIGRILKKDDKPVIADGHYIPDGYSVLASIDPAHLNNCPKYSLEYRSSLNGDWSIDISTVFNQDLTDPRINKLVTELDKLTPDEKFKAAQVIFSVVIGETQIKADIPHKRI